MLTPEQYAKAGTEHAHQVAVFMWIQQTGQHTYPELNRLFAIPNGGLRNKATAGRLKAEGVKSGVLDLMLPLPLARFHGMFLEMKKPGDLDRTTPEQDNWIGWLRSVSYYCRVADNWESARDELVAYVTGQFRYNIDQRGSR
jgi:hypothetical protein